MQKQPDGTARADPRHTDPLPRPRQLCRRRRGLCRGRYAGAGAGCRRTDRGRLRRRGPAAGTATALDPKRRWSGPNSARTAPLPIISATAPRPTRPSPGRSRVTRIDFVNNRLVSNYMEARSAIGEWRADEDRFVLTTGSQGVHSMQGILAKQCSGSARKNCASSRPMSAAGSVPRASSTANIRWCWRPQKGWAARSMGRRSHRALPHRRPRPRQSVTAEMAMDDAGRFLALRIDLVANMGAYVSQYGPFIPSGHTVGRRDRIPAPAMFSSISQT